MDREVGWTESAVNDLEEIAEHIAKDSEYYAVAVVRELLAAGGSLANLADRGRIVPEYQDPKTRELIVGSYRLVYRLGDQVVQVLRIIHGSRLLPERL